MVRSMTSGNPIRLILAFTVPLLIGNVFQQFYNIADIIIVGRTIGVNALAAVGAVAPVFMAVFGLTIGLSSGFSVITGQRFGAEDMDGVRRSVATSAMLALVITLMLTACVSLAMPLIMRLMNISDVLYDDAYHYMLIVVLGLVAMMSYNLLSCICRALGDSRTPLYFLIVSSLLRSPWPCCSSSPLAGASPARPSPWSSPRPYRPCSACVSCAAAFPCCA